MYEIMLNRIRVFPPMTYGASDFLCGEANQEKVQLVLGGYLDAIKHLDAEGITFESDGYVMISAKFIETNKNPKVWLNNGARNAPRMLFTPIFSVFPQLLNFISKNTQDLFRSKTLNWKRQIDLSRNFVNPKNPYSFPAQAATFISGQNRHRSLHQKSARHHIPKN
jgi:hypothetical protein